MQLDNISQNIIDNFIQAIKKVGLEKVVNQDSKAKNIIDARETTTIGDLPILSPTVTYAFVKGMQKEFSQTHPKIINRIFNGTLIELSMNQVHDSLNWQNKNRILFDPESQYAVLAAEAAIASQNSKSEQPDTWSWFLLFSPTYDQITKYEKIYQESIKGDQYAQQLSKDLEELKSYKKSSQCEKLPDCRPPHGKGYKDFCLIKQEEHFRLNILYPEQNRKTIPNAPAFDREESNNGWINAKVKEKNTSHEETVVRSRETLLENPAESYALLLSKMTSMNPSYTQKILLPVLCARAEFMSQFSGNFIYYARHYLRSAVTKDPNESGIEHDQLFFYANKKRLEIGEQNAHLDLQVIAEQTNLIQKKYTP